MNVVDSSGWLEYFADTPNAAAFAAPLEDLRSLIVPSISILEVFKKILRERGPTEALEKAAYMKQGKVVDLDEALAVEAARLGLEHKLPLADSIILATARHFGATLWTQDDDFEGIEGVKYFKKNS